MKNIFITGASGQLGLALFNLLQDKKEYKLYRTDAFASEDGEVTALDITDEKAVAAAMESIHPDIIINCAAFTAVDLCESEQEKAYRINALGPKYLAVNAEKCGAKFIHISTDYVYDGKADKPYIETDSTGPISVYGKSKLEGDLFVIENCSRTFVLRTAWVYGEGKNFVKTMLRLAENGNHIKVVSDQYGSPTSSLELARVIVFLMETESYGMYHATCEGSTNWYEFAVTIFQMAEKEAEVEAIPTSEYPTPAKRPMYSVLDNKALRELHGYKMKHWKEALEEYMNV